MDGLVRGLLTGPLPFRATAGNGALIGPFPMLLRFPEFSRPFLEWYLAVASRSVLPSRVREVAILTTGSRYRAAYEVYSHSRMAVAAELSDGVVAALAAGERPAELTPEEQVAHDLASCLYRGGAVPGVLYRAAIAAFGETGMAELVFLIAQYASISAILNAYDVPLPEED